MLQTALFWVDALWTDEHDGTLVVNPSYSPEHGEYSLGCTSSQDMVYEMFDMTKKAAQILARGNDKEIKENGAMEHSAVCAHAVPSKWMPNGTTAV